jgi:putative transcriptional regulator
MRKHDFEKLVESVKQAGKIRAPADIKAIRMRLAKSQSEFALMIGVSVSTLQNWEQGRRVPEGPARALLKIAAENPDAVIEALGA